MCCCGCGLITLSQVQAGDTKGTLARDQGDRLPRAGRLRALLRRLMRRLRLHGRALEAAP